MAVLRFVVLGGVVAMVSACLRALVHGGLSLQLASRWALAGGLLCGAVWAVPRVLRPWFDRERCLALTLGVALFTLLVGTLALVFAAGKRDPEIASSVLMGVSVVLAPLLWAWATLAARYLAPAVRSLERAWSMLARPGRRGDVLTGLGGLVLAVVVALGFTGLGT